MSPPRPYEFDDEQEVINHLRGNGRKISEWFEHRESLDEAIRVAVGANVFRVFRNMPHKPSVVFRQWAFAEFTRKKTTNYLKAIRSKAAFDAWTSRLSKRFRETWFDKMDCRMPYGPSRKLPDLLLKRLTRWTDLTDSERMRLILNLNVPLDSYTLVGIRHCIHDLEIPRSATMKFVAGEIMYDHIQPKIRRIAGKARVPAIYFDVLAWDMAH